MAVQNVSIAQIKTYPVGSPIPVLHGTLAVVYDYRTGIGQNNSTIQSAMLRDAAGEQIRLNMWNHPDYTSRKGAAITIIAKTEKGKCSTKTKTNDHYNPPALEIEISKASQILFSSEQAMTPPPDHSEYKALEEEPRRSQPVSRPINGQNVGMAIKEAISILKDERKQEDGDLAPDYYFSPDFSKDVWQLASDIIRVSQILESGKLAPSAKDRVSPPEPEPEPEPVPPPKTNPRPGPDNSAYDPSDPSIDSEMPF